MRYAVYYAPAPRSALWRAGSEWLGWDAARGVTLLPPALPGGLLARLAPLTRRAAHYGWHATLKAPFRLADGVDEATLLQQVAALAATSTPFSLPLQVGTLRDATVLRVAGDTAAIDALAERCVRQLLPLGAPAPDRPGLSPREAELHAAWGYPYVLDQFCFHLTLAQRSREPALQAAIERAAITHFDRVLQADVAALSVFVETRPDEPMRLLAECGFDGSLTRHLR